MDTGWVRSVMNRLTSPTPISWFRVAMHREPIYISSANTRPINVWIKILSGIMPFREVTEIPRIVPQSVLRTTIC